MIQRVTAVYLYPGFQYGGAHASCSCSQAPMHDGCSSTHLQTSLAPPSHPKSPRKSHPITGRFEIFALKSLSSLPSHMSSHARGTFINRQNSLHTTQCFRTRFTLLPPNELSTCITLLPLNDIITCITTTTTKDENYLPHPCIYIMNEILLRYRTASYSAISFICT